MADFGEGWLAATMVTMVLDGIPLNQVVLMGKVCGHSFTKNGKIFSSFFFEASVGSSIFFFFFWWHDCWCKEGPLRDPYPYLYVLAMNRDATIADYCQRGPGRIVWSPFFIHDALVDDSILATFLSKLSEIIPRDSPDVVTWDLNSKGVFIVKSSYLELLSYFVFAMESSFLGRFPWKIIWKTLAPLKVSIFCVGSFTW